MAGSREKNHMDEKPTRRSFALSGARNEAHAANAGLRAALAGPPAPKEPDPRDAEIARLQEALDEIGRVAMSCWMDMQGRLVDDEHRRAHGVLGSIAKAAAATLPFAKQD